MAEEMRLRALVVGDSFVNRLRGFIREQSKCPDFGLKVVTVSLKGIGPQVGAMAAQLGGRVPAPLDHFPGGGQ